VISAVTEELELLLRPKAGGGYSLFGPDFKNDYRELAAAKKAAMELALSGISEKARAGCIEEFIVEISLEDEIIDLDAGQLYMETTVHAAACAIV
jgi:hypothetical protein